MSISDWSSDVCSSDLIRRLDGADRDAAAVQADVVVAEIVGDDQDDVGRAFARWGLGGTLLPCDGTVRLDRVLPVLDDAGEPVFIRLERPISACPAQSDDAQRNPPLPHFPSPALRSTQRRVGTAGVSTCRFRGSP